MMRSNDFSFLETLFTKTANGASNPPNSLEEVEAYKYAMSQPGKMALKK